MVIRMKKSILLLVSIILLNNIFFGSGVFAQVVVDGVTTQYDSMTVFLKTRNLDEVSVVHQAPVVKLKTDKITYQVSQDADSKTKTVLEMLRKVPMVTVDGRNNITVNGSGQFKVYVDGRLNTMITRNPSQMLRNMPANTIKSIEVLTNPGAQYDAEGAGGVLLITTKKKDLKLAFLSDEDGMGMPTTSGSVHTSFGTKNLGVDASLSTQKGRLSFDMNLMGEFMNSPGSTMETETTGAETSQLMKLKTHEKMPFTMANMGLGYEIDSVNSVHATYSLMGFGMKNNGAPSYLYKGGMWGDGISFSGLQSSNMNEVSMDGSVDYLHLWGKDSKGKMAINYQFSHSPSQNDMDNTYNFDKSETILHSYLRDNKSRIREHGTSHQLLNDYTIPIKDNFTLNTGLKITLERNKSNAKELVSEGGSFIEDKTGSINYIQKLCIAAVYAEFEVKWGSFNIKNGYRYEHTWQSSRYLLGEGSDFHLDYGDLVPTFGISSTMGESQTVGINYNMRIRRPRISELDPFVNKSDPTIISYGNPHLSAQKLNHIDWVYTLSTQPIALRMSLRHNWSNDGISQYSFLKEGKVNTTFGNVLSERNTSLNTFVSWSITGSARLLVNGEVGYAHLQSKELDEKNQGWQANANVSYQQSLPWNLKLDTSVEWMSKRYSLQGWESGMSMFNTSISKSFCNDRLNIAISGMTGLGHGGQFVWKSMSNSKDFKTVNVMKESMQDIMIGITYNFGGKRNGYDMPNSVGLEGMDMDGGGMNRRQMHRRGR